MKYFFTFLLLLTSLALGNVNAPNSLDHLDKLNYPGGKQLDYDVDALGRVTQIRYGNRRIVGNGQYHPNGTVKSLNLGNGSRYATLLDNRQMLKQIAVDNNRVKLDYGYDAVGNVSTIIQTGQANKSLHYDGLNRLTTVSYSNGGSANYSYDARSNIKSKRLSNIPNAVNANWTYQYDGNNRLSGISGSVYNRFTYDTAGNVSNDGRHSYIYNGNHQLSGIDNSQRLYYYDANDERVWEQHGSTNSKQQLNFYHGGKLLGEYDFADFSAKREYVHLGNHTIAQFEAGRSVAPTWLFADSFEGGGSAANITYLYKDALGSTVAKANSSGRILWQENRLPFGKNTKLSNTEIANNPLQYTNAPLDSHSGLTYLKARYYNADIGRFYALDPVWFSEDNVQMFNRYAYGNNNPYRYVDPTGMKSVGQSIDNWGETTDSEFSRAVAAFASAAWGVFGAEDISLMADGQKEVSLSDFAMSIGDLLIGKKFKIAKEGVGIAKNKIVDTISDGYIYRAGSSTPTNLTPRTKDITGLSANLNPLSGKNQVIDTSKFTNLCAVCDNPKTGHVSIQPKDMNQMKGWIESRGTNNTHPLTKELMDSIVDQIKYK